MPNAYRDARGVFAPKPKASESNGQEQPPTSELVRARSENDTEASAEPESDAGSENSTIAADSDEEHNSYSNFSKRLTNSYGFDNRGQDPWGDFETSVYHFDAGLVISQLIKEPSLFIREDLVPEYFDAKNGSSFAELYYYFRVNFSKRSRVYEAYICLSQAAFHASFSGSDGEIERAVCIVKSQFDSAFRACIEPEYLRSFSSWGFTKEVVQTKFLDVALRDPDPFSYMVRYNRHVERALAGETTPLVFYYQAHSVSDHDIWYHIAPLLIRQCRCASDRVKFYEVFTRAMQLASRRNVPVSISIDSFVSQLEHAELFMRPKAKKVREADMDSGCAHKRQKPDCSNAGDTDSE